MTTAVRLQAGTRVRVFAPLSRTELPGNWILSHRHSNGVCWYVKNVDTSELTIVADTRFEVIT